jgi:hypothetical protein
MPAGNTPSEVKDAMTTLDPLATIRDLMELIDAIDRRAPQLQRTGEAEIATTALRLRDRAAARIVELERISAAASIDPARN